MSLDVIYADNNATTATAPEVIEEVARVLREVGANPSSQHRPGQKARQLLEDARDEIITLLGGRAGGVAADRLVLTSGGTEANNLAIAGLVDNPPANAPRLDTTLHNPPAHNVVVSTLEHPSIATLAEHLRENGREVRWLPADSRGVARVEELAMLADQRTSLATLMLANHETGALQPVTRFATICRSLGITSHTDATQAVGKIPVNFAALGVDAMSLAAHKFHGPPGVGGLLLRHAVAPRPILWGGFQQGATRPGTECVALARGMLVALRLWRDRHQACVEQLTELRDQLELAIRGACPDAIINAESAERLPNTTNLAIPGLDRQALLMALDLAGVACSAGSACASGSSEPSPVLRSMGLDEAVIRGSIRISLSYLTQPSEVPELARRILLVLRNLRDSTTTRKLPLASRHTRP